MPDRRLNPPEPPLSSRRILLRPFRDEDAIHVAESCQDQLIPEFTFMPEAMTVEQARRWIANRNERWPDGLASFAITNRGSDKPVGQIGAKFEWEFNRAEAFYWLDAAARGQGLVTEALNLITQWAMKDYDIVRVQLLTHLNNAASQRVAERCGFTREGVLRAWEPVDNDQPDLVMWSRLGSDPRP